MVADLLRVPSVCKMTATPYEKFIRSIYLVCRWGTGPRCEEDTESIGPIFTSIQELSLVGQETEDKNSCSKMQRHTE